MNAIIELKDIKRDFLVGNETVHALRGVSFAIQPGEFVTIMGTSGSGKSTLLNVLGCLDTPTAGEYWLDGYSVRQMGKNERAELRNHKIGFVFQSYNLVPVLSVYENVALPVELDGKKADRAFIEEILDTLGILQKARSLPGQLSGGQQQRAAIARALASRPSILLCDEPTGNLDSRTSQDVLGLLKLSGQKFGQTIVMITHNEEIAQMADRIIRIEDGRILSSRGRREV